MKLKCVQDYWPAKEPNFIGFGGKPKTKIEGLTENNEYEGTPIAKVYGSIGGGSGDVYSKTHFLIFNDDGEWESYQLDLFEPVEEE